MITVVQELGHLALAVIQAGAYILKSECSMDVYLQLYRQCHSYLPEEYRDYTHKIDEYEWTVYTTWQLSFEWLRTHSVQAATFLQRCVSLHHDGISEASKGCEVVVSGKVCAAHAKSMKFTDGFMIHSGQPTHDVVDYAIHHVLLKQGVLGIEVKVFVQSVYFYPDRSDLVPQHEEL